MTIAVETIGAKNGNNINPKIVLKLKCILLTACVNKYKAAPKAVAVKATETIVLSVIGAVKAKTLLDAAIAIDITNIIPEIAMVLPMVIPFNFSVI